MGGARLGEPAGRVLARELEHPLRGRHVRHRQGRVLPGELAPSEPVEPTPTTWDLPDPRAAAPGDDLVGIGADLEPGTLLAAYRSALFPMRVGDRGPLGWWSPDPRGVVPLDGAIVHRSLRKARRRFSVTVDRCFEAVMRGCGDPRRPDGWIDDEFVAAYTRLHELGWAHSVEVWTPDRVGDPDGLVGGLYGVAVGGLFAGESMFHRARDASKVAFVETVERLGAGGGAVFDVQWCTPHLASLGAVEVDRVTYVDAVTAAVARPQLALRR